MGKLCIKLVWVTVDGQFHVDSGSFTVDHCITATLESSTTGDFYVYNCLDTSWLQRRTSVTELQHIWIVNL